MLTFRSTEDSCALTCKHAKQAQYEQIDFPSWALAEFDIINVPTSGPGPPLRWAGEWFNEMGDLAGGWENAARSRSISKSRASYLYQHNLCRPNRMRLACKDGSSADHSVLAFTL